VKQTVGPVRFLTGKTRDTGDRPGIQVARPAANGGFTLAELLVALAVAAILVATAVPSLRAFVQDARLSSAADEFLATIQLARTEAVTRGDAVILCRTANPGNDQCRDSANKDWTPGWLMYAAPGSSGEIDYTDSADNVLIQRGSPAPAGVTITSDNDGNQWLTFAADGSLRESGPLAYAVCDNRGVAEGRLIVVPMLGRPYLTEDMSAAPNCQPN
jgi:type IV fimbrial biogenesis protein FimT